MEQSPRASFSTQLPGIQLAWDSTSLGEVKLCLRRYFYSIVIGYRGRTENVHLKFGILYHSAIERYHHWRFDGDPHEVALRRVIRWTLEATWDKELHRGWTSLHKEKNRLSLIRTIIWYLDKYQNDSMETVKLSNGEPAVELSFRFDMDLPCSVTGEPLLLCGHLDRLVTFAGDAWIADYKTTTSDLGDRYFGNYSPDNQMSLYSFGSRVAYQIPTKGIIIDAAQIGVTFSRFDRRPIPRDAENLEEWYRDTLYYISQAHRAAELGYWPTNDKSCGFMGGCPYREVCSMPPRGRQHWLDSAFVVFPWDPLRVRGDI